MLRPIGNCAASRVARKTPLVTNPAPVSYHWRHAGTNLPGPSALGSACTVSNASTALAGAYSCVVPTAAGAVSSSVATLTVVSDTSTWKHHSMFSDVPWTREIEKIIGWDGYAYAPVWINKVDATKRNIKDGDIVRVYNERGSVLGGAVISERIVPGALRFEKAGGGHHITPGELHRGGNPNCINPKDSFSNKPLGAFWQDSFRVRSNLTLNLGVRYDIEFPPQLAALSGLPLAAYNQLGLQKGIDTDKNNVQPRIGLVRTRGWRRRRTGGTCR